MYKDLSHPENSLCLLLQPVIMLSRLIELSERASKDFTLALGFSILSALYLLRRWLLPKPIPGIPYNKNAVKSFMGDIPEFRDAPNRREWWAQQPARHQSPIVQVFMRPFGAPWVFVADYFESSDICMRRLKEFDRSNVTWEQFNGVVPGHHITLKSSDPKFKKNKELIRDLMAPTFLHQVTRHILCIRVFADVDRPRLQRFTTSSVVSSSFGTASLTYQAADRSI